MLDVFPYVCVRLKMNKAFYVFAWTACRMLMCVYLLVSGLFPVYLAQPAMPSKCAKPFADRRFDKMFFFDPMTFKEPGEYKWVSDAETGRLEGVAFVFSNKILK